MFLPKLKKKKHSQKSFLTEYFSKRENNFEPGKKGEEKERTLDYEGKMGMGIK